MESAPRAARKSPTYGGHSGTQWAGGLCVSIRSACPSVVHVHPWCVSICGACPSVAHVRPWCVSVCGACPSVAALGVVSLQGVIADLRLQGDPRAAERQCEEEEDDAEEVSTGSPDGAGWGGLLPQAPG